MMFNLKQSMAKDKNVIGYGELEMPFDGISPLNRHHLHLIQSLQSTNHQHHNHMPTKESPFSSCSSVGGFCSSEDVSSASLNFSDSTMMHQTLIKNNPNEHLLDKLGLAENFGRMGIGKEHNGGLNNMSFGASDTRNVGNLNPPVGFAGFSNGYNQYGRVNSLGHGQSMSFEGGTEATLLAFGRGYHLADSMESTLCHSQFNTLYSDPIFHKDQMDYPLKLRIEQRKSYCDGGIQLQRPIANRHYVNDGFDLDGSRSFLNPLSSSQLMNVSFPLSKEDLKCGSSILERRSGVKPNTRAQPSCLSGTDLGELEGFSCEDSIILQGKSLKCVAERKCGQSGGKNCKRNPSNGTVNQRLEEKNMQAHGPSLSEGVCQNGYRLAQSQSGGICEDDLSRFYSPFLSQPTLSSLAELKDYVCSMAKDQLGCRFLQRVFEEGTHQDVHIIFNQLIDHVPKLMVDPFGNYLVQKLLGVCNEEQRMRFVLMVTRKPGVLVKICLDAYGTRVVQKLIETLKTRQQISLVIQALEPGFLDLIKDLNGNHVLQRCLQSLSHEDNKFIFDAAAKNCVEIATHRHGCCVLNRCIAHSTGKYREKLVAEISAHGLLLAQDAFGNYVVQYLIELKIPSIAATLASQFIGHYVCLSMQKFSSHVVEKLLNCFKESRPRIVHELLSAPHFDQLLQDPFANYVIQSALEVTKGPLHALLVEAVEPYKILRTSPYCKKIFNRNLLKK